MCMCNILECWFKRPLPYTKRIYTRLDNIQIMKLRVQIHSNARTKKGYDHKIVVPLIESQKIKKGDTRLVYEIEVLI
jgi:hypothetical protein